MNKQLLPSLFISGIFLLLTSGRSYAQQFVWNNIPTGTQYNIHEVSFANDSVGYFVSDTVDFNPQGKVYRTQNRGLIWSLVNYTSHNIKHIHAPSSNTVYVNGNNGLYTVLRRSVNGGTTWLNMNVSSPEGPMEFLNDTMGFIASSGGLGNVMHRTSDSGLSFDTAYFGGYACGMFDIQYVTDSIAFAGGLYGPKLAKTTQQLGGWTDLTNDYAVRGICMLNKDTGYAVAEYTPIFSNILVIRTYDGGNSWTQLPGSNDPNGNGWAKIHCRNVMECICVGGGGSIASTNDGGFTWNFESSGTSEILTDVYYGSNYALAVGEMGTVLRRVPVPQSLNEITNGNALTIFPNPAGNNTTIKGVLKTGDLVCITDASGREVYREVIRENTINHAVTTSAFANGLYFVTIQNTSGKSIAKLIKE